MSEVLEHIFIGIAVSAPLAFAGAGIMKLLNLLQRYILDRLEKKRKSDDSGIVHL